MWIYSRLDSCVTSLYESVSVLVWFDLKVVLTQSTEIGKAVNGLRKHGSDQIRQLAKTLIAYEFLVVSLNMTWH